MKSKSTSDIHQIKQGSAFLSTAQAVVFTKHSQILEEPKNVQKVSASNLAQQIEIVNWGSANNLPVQIREAVEKSTDMSAAMLFNISLGYGDGIQAMRLVDGIPTPATEPEIIDFFEQNSINPNYALEQITDLNWFYNCFPEIILDKAGKKIVEINHKEAEFSRLSKMNSKGKIEYHLYSGKWGRSPSKSDIEATPYLDNRRPYFDLLEQVKKSERRFIVPVSFPTPGRSYYQKPYWYSLIESGWFDFAVGIPELKKAMLKNQMSLKYLIEIDPRYWDLLFKKEGITTDEEKSVRVKAEYQAIQNFLVGTKNAGKSWIVPLEYSPAMKEARSFIKITEIPQSKGGEYLADASDVSNTIAYAMGVHSGLIGSAPGKNSGSLSGTDKREMFIIKQALLKPFRDILLAPFTLTKQFNQWPKDIFFTIPNLVLTSLDANTGSEKVIS